MIAGGAFALVLVSSLLVALSQRETPTFPVGTDVVRLDVLASARGVPLTGLGPDDFEVRDNGVVQNAHVAPAASFHWDVVVLFDLSQSVEGAKLEALRASARATEAALRAGDRIALLTFADGVHVRVPLSASAARLGRALDGLRARGSTALFDAVFAGLALSGTGSGRPLLLLFTDGRDTVSWLAAEDVLEAARQSDVPIHAVRIASRRPALAPATWASTAEGSDDDFLRRLTRETGGRVFDAGSASEMQARFAEALADIGARYVLTYEPIGVAREGWHGVQVRLRRHRGTVTVRPGYMARPSWRPAGGRQRPRSAEPNR